MARNLRGTSPSFSVAVGHRPARPGRRVRPGSGVRPAGVRRRRRRRRQVMGPLRPRAGAGGAGPRAWAGEEWGRRRAGEPVRAGPGPAGHRLAGAGRSSTARSTRSSRSPSAAVESSSSGRARRTSATSSTTRGSGASRMSTWAWPKSLHGPDQAGRPTGRPGPTAASLDAAAPSSGARATRNAWRRSSTSSAASCWGPHPASVQRGHGDQDPAGVVVAQGLDHGRRARAGASSAEPQAATWSRAEQGVPGRAPPPPHGHRPGRRRRGRDRLGVTDVEQRLERVGAEQPELEVLGPAADRRGHLLRDRWWPGRRRRGRAAPPASSAGRWPRRSRACGPRRRCRPSSGPGCRGRRGRPGRAWRRPRCWRRRRARGRRATSPGRSRRTRCTSRTVPRRRAGAVEGPGQDPGGRRLAGAPGAAEQVGVGHVAVAHRVAQGEHHVGLAPQLAEPARAGSAGRARRTGRRAPRCRPARPRCSWWPSLPVAPAHREGAGARAPAGRPGERSHDRRLGATARLATAHGQTR